MPNLDQLGTEQTPAPPCRKVDGQTIHPRAYEDGPQRDGYPGGDTVRMRCPDCGVTWIMELPQ